MLEAATSQVSISCGHATPGEATGLHTGSVRLRSRIKGCSATLDHTVHPCGARREDKQRTGFFMETARSLGGEAEGATRQ